MYPIRINKYLALSGVCSRREADQIIEKGQVLINNRKAKLGDKILSEDDQVMYKGKLVKPHLKKTYIAFHKPFGVITTTNPEVENSILHYIKTKERVFPIGRLDVQSSGLILLTNDGDLAYKISRAEFGVEKEYLVTVNKNITPQFLKKMAEGVFILDQKTLPAKVEKISANQFKIILTQGLNRQIRRMCEALGYEVKILKRTRVMNIELGDLARGKWRYLTEEEIGILK